MRGNQVPAEHLFSIINLMLRVLEMVGIRAPPTFLTGSAGQVLKTKLAQKLGLKTWPKGDDAAQKHSFAQQPTNRQLQARAQHDNNGSSKAFQALLGSLTQCASTTRVEILVGLKFNHGKSLALEGSHSWAEVIVRAALAASNAGGELSLQHLAPVTGAMADAMSKNAGRSSGKVEGVSKGGQSRGCLGQKQGRTDDLEPEKENEAPGMGGICCRILHGTGKTNVGMEILFPTPSHLTPSQADGSISICQNSDNSIDITFEREHTSLLSEEMLAGGEEKVREVFKDMLSDRNKGLSDLMRDVRSLSLEVERSNLCKPSSPLFMQAATPAAETVGSVDSSAFEEDENGVTCDLTRKIALPGMHRLETGDNGALVAEWQDCEDPRLTSVILKNAVPGQAAKATRRR